MDIYCCQSLRHFFYSPLAHGKLKVTHGLCINTSWGSAAKNGKNAIKIYKLVVLLMPFFSSKAYAAKMRKLCTSQISAVEPCLQV